jgi:hypothetical protein
MNLLSNIKDKVTSAIGLTIVVITIIGLARTQITWQWDGAIGVSVGTLFFLIPDKIVNLILDTLTQVKEKLIGK